VRSQISGEHIAGECLPPIDVFETDRAVEIVVDLPGVAADLIEVLIKGSAILITGEKPPRRTRGDSSFHLVERGFGRFARMVQLTTPCDGSHASATLRDGELRISIPKVTERRGQPITVPIA
jgi:HSP20 family protein